MMDQFQSHSGEGPIFPREIARGAVSLLDELGKGAFGLVFKAVLKESMHMPGYLVAAKSLHEKCSAGDKQELMEEAAVMAQFQHPHVTSLVGVVTVGKPVLVIVEYMEHGSLKGYLEKHDPSPGQQLLWAGDVADGLAHVHAKGFIHRDVACRNVLLSSEMRAKVSDFGLARELDEDDTYYRSRGGQLPVRWSALEALEDRKFNEKTDVYSYGVALYEMWTNAEMPYKGWTNQRVWVEVAAGYRLPQPPGCQSNIYDIMYSCWAPAQADRPTFAALKQKFRDLYEEVTGNALEDVGYLAVNDSDGESVGGRGGYAITRAFSKLASRFSMKKRVGSAGAHPNPGYVPRQGSVLVHNPIFEDATSGDADDLYDMGEDDISMPLPEKRAQPTQQTMRALTEEEELYDLGDEEEAHGVATLPAAQAAGGDGAEGGEAEPLGFEVDTREEEMEEPDLYGNFAADGQVADATRAPPVGAADVGRRVQIQGYSCGGTLCFYGTHHEKGTPRCGVALDEPLGKNNGTVGVRWGTGVGGGGEEEGLVVGAWLRIDRWFTVCAFLFLFG